MAMAFADIKMNDHYQERNDIEHLEQKKYGATVPLESEYKHQMDKLIQDNELHVYLRRTRKAESVDGLALMKNEEGIDSNLQTPMIKKNVPDAAKTVSLKSLKAENDQEVFKSSNRKVLMPNRRKNDEIMNHKIEEKPPRKADPSEEAPSEGGMSQVLAKNKKRNVGYVQYHPLETNHGDGAGKVDTQHYRKRSRSTRKFTIIKQVVLTLAVVGYMIYNEIRFFNLERRILGNPQQQFTTNISNTKNSTDTFAISNTINLAHEKQVEIEMFHANVIYPLNSPRHVLSWIPKFNSTFLQLNTTKTGIVVQKQGHYSIIGILNIINDQNTLIGVEVCVLSSSGDGQCFVETFKPHERRSIPFMDTLLLQARETIAVTVSGNLYQSSDAHLMEIRRN